jgi:LysM repeat protein
MTLPSQSARPQSRTSHMFRRRRNRRVFVVFSLAALLVLTFGVWAWTRSDTPQSSYADSPQLAMSDQPSSSGSDSPASSSDHPPALRNIEPDAPRITMGQRVPISSSPPAPPPDSAASRESAGGGWLSSSRSQEQAAQRDSSSSASATTPRESAASRDTRTNTPPAGRSEPPSSAADHRIADRVRVGMELLRTNKPVEARRVLTQALLTPGIDRRTAKTIRETLTELNERLVFGREIAPDDPFAFGYTVRPGDALARIATQQNAHVDWRFIQRINSIARPESIRPGQQLKIIQGPFHAVVVKREYRVDVFLGEGSDRVYVRSYPVGLGEHDSTPVGRFRVRSSSKLINPAWTNPRTGEHFTSNDPKNPIGNRWIGLEGMTEAIRDLAGYGIHGTIEPESIGRQESMGCIRLLNEHVEVLYEMLVERESTVEIVERM